MNENKNIFLSQQTVIYYIINLHDAYIMIISSTTSIDIIINYI